MWILGHRGASKAAPENTLAAFALAMAQQAHGIEIDTYQVDGKIVVIHDRWLNRTTNGDGMVTSHSLHRAVYSALQWRSFSQYQPECLVLTASPGDFFHRLATRYGR